ncbi:MAG: VOC family protein [Alphaproteobacteria bacterium]
MAVKAQAKSARTAAKKGAAAAKSAGARPRKPATAKTTRAAPTAAAATSRKASGTAKTTTAGKAARPSRHAAPTFALSRLGQVALTATDMDKAVAFYSDVLGLRLIARFDPPGLAFFNLHGGTRLLLSATASEASLYFNVEDVAAAVRALKKRGVEFLQKPAMIHRDEAGEFGKKGVEEWMAFFHDPSGNLLALVEKR